MDNSAVVLLFIRYSTAALEYFQQFIITNLNITHSSICIEKTEEFG